MPLLLVVAACRGSAPADGAATKPATSGYDPWSPPALDPTKVDVVELRDSRTVPRKEHDVVFRLVREGSEFAWTAKGIALGTLGERVPDPSPAAQSPYAKACVCGIGVKCDCEHTGEEVVAKSGRVAASKVEAFLSRIGRQTTRPWDPEAGRVASRRHTAHVVAFFAGREQPVHYSMLDERQHWIADGQPIVPEPGADADADPTPALDAAWGKLLEDLDVPNWDRVLNPPPPVTAPEEYAGLAGAVTVDVYDSWVGLGVTHAMFAHLSRTAAGFVMKAKIASHEYVVSEPLHDPWDPKGTRALGASCKCAIDATCECERGVLRKSGTVPLAPVEEFLAEVARHRIDPEPTVRGRMWSDDYPRGHTAVWLAPWLAPIHLSFLDQQRQWRLNGRELASDPAPSDSMTSGAHPMIHAAYRKMLDAIGLATWMKELGKGVGR